MILLKVELGCLEGYKVEVDMENSSNAQIQQVILYTGRVHLLVMRGEHRLYILWEYHDYYFCCLLDILTVFLDPCVVVQAL